MRFTTIFQLIMEVRYSRFSNPTNSPTFSFLRYWSLIPAFLFSLTLLAQSGKHGDLTISSPSTKVNEYTALTQDLNLGDDVLTVTSNTMNDSGRFSGPLEPGDLLLIVQVQGVLFKFGSATTYPYSTPALDPTWGEIWNYYRTGRFEFAQVAEIIGSDQIKLTCGLAGDGEASVFGGGMPHRILAVRVPRYNSLTVEATGVLTADPWDGTVGGVLAVEVEGQTIIDGVVTATGLGFRGGELDDKSNSSGQMAYAEPEGGAEKGESIYGFTAEYALLNGVYGKGAPANGGGGGNGSEAGGGGGSNSVANFTTWNNGLGIPDPNPAYDAAWALETNTFLTTHTGGGRGGYSRSAPDNAVDPLTVEPGNVLWKGDDRQEKGGLGGRGLNPKGDLRIFMGGGGGAGDAGHAGMLYGGTGGRGGGMIFFTAYGDISGSGSVINDGEDGDDADNGGVPLFLDNFSGDDGAGGAGGGGAIRLECLGNISGVNFQARGGKGGDQIMQWSGPDPLEAQGPGGGGGGGYIASNKALPSADVSGGLGGTTNATFLTDFPYNGATGGSEGYVSPAVNFYYLTASSDKDSVCVGETANLTGVEFGDPYVAGTLTWYDEQFDGNVLGTGSTYTTPPLTETDTFYFGHCPTAARRFPVIVAVRSTYADAGNDTTICASETLTLHADSGATFLWSPLEGPVDGDGNNMVISPTISTRYFVTVTEANGCPDTANIMVTVTNGLTTTLTPDTTVCMGDSVPLKATGGTVYAWSDGAYLTADNIANPVAFVTVTHKFYVTISAGGGCPKVDSVTVDHWPDLQLNLPDDSLVCPNELLTVTASVSGGNSGPYEYLWSNLTTTSANALTPISDTTLYITVTETATTCLLNDSVVVTLSPALQMYLPTDTSSCDPEMVFSPLATGGTGDLDYVWFDATVEVSDTNLLTIDPYVAGDYFITVTDKSGCILRDEVTVGTQGALGITLTEDTSICAGNSVQLEATGGVNYTWSNGSDLDNAAISNPIASPTVTTKFYVTVDDGAGCFAIDSVTIDHWLDLQIDLVDDTLVCPEEVLNFEAIATGGDNGPYQYVWSNLINTSSNSLVPVSDTTLYVTVTETATSCAINDSIEVSFSPAIEMYLPTDTSSCDLAMILSPEATGGTGDLDYVWFDSSVEVSDYNLLEINPYVSGDYFITVTDKAGCLLRKSVIINPQGSMSITTSIDTTICQGNSVQISASGGVNYSWSNAGDLDNASIADPTATPSTTTTYLVTVDDGAGCEAIDSVQVTVALPMTVTVTEIGNSCPGDTAIIAAGVSGGVGTYDYFWTNGQTTITIAVEPLVSTTYDLTVTDAAQCTMIATHNRAVNEIIGLNLADSITACQGADVNLTATISGSGPYTFTWSDGPTGSSPDRVWSASNSETLTLTVTDGICSEIDSIALTTPGSPNVVITGGGDICEGGTVTLSASGAVDYTWNGPGVTNQSGASLTVSPLVDGWYVVNGLVAADCEGIDSVQVTISPAFTVDITGDSTVCDPMTTDVTVNASGVGPHFYDWSTGDQTASITTSTALDVTELLYVTVTSGSCQVKDSVFTLVESAPNLSVSGGGDVCLGSAVTLIATGATAYQWTGPEISTTNSDQVTLTPTIDGWYVMTASTSPNCTAVDSVQIMVGTKVSIDIQGDTLVCEPNTVDLTAVLSDATGFAYSWSSGANTSAVSLSLVTDVPEYAVVSVTDGTCDGIDSVQVAVVSAPILTLTGDGEYCAGATVSLSASGLTDYNWSGPELSSTATSDVSFNPTLDGWYVMNASVGGDCSVIDSVFITVGGALDLTITGDTSLCDGGTADLIATMSATGSYSYNWSSGENTSVSSVSPSVQTTYTVTVTAGSCQAQATQTVYVGASPSVTMATEFIVCEGADVALSATGAGGTGQLDYGWALDGTPIGSGNAISIPTPSDGTAVAVGVVDDNGCTAAAVGVITVIAGPTIGLIPDAVEICQGGDMSISASGAADYLWSGSGVYNQNTGQVVQGTFDADGYIVVQGTNTDGCVALDSVFVEVSESMTLTATRDGIVCADTDFIIGVAIQGGTAPYSYAWSSGDNTSVVSVNSGQVIQNFDVTVTDDLTCDEQLSFTLTPSTTPTISVDGDQSLCEGSVYSINTTVNNGDGNNTWNWTLPDTAFTTTSNGITRMATVDGQVCVAVTDGCDLESNTACMNLTVEPVPVASFTGTQSDNCGTAVTLSNSTHNAIAYEWSVLETFTADTAAFIHDFGQSGLQTVVLIAHGSSCSDTTEQTFTFDAAPVVTTLADPTRSAADVGEFDLSSFSDSTIVSWSWMLTDSLISATNEAHLTLNEVGFYEVLLTADDGTCETTTTVTLEVYDADLDENGIRVPNTITPNGDGKNDTWIISNIQSYPDHKVQIFNRNGHLIYESENYSDDWAGEWQKTANPAPATTYYYVIELTSSRVAKGNITIVREN